MVTNLGSFTSTFSINDLLGEKCPGDRSSNVRLTGMATACVSGEKLEMFVISKSVTPRCFKHIRNLRRKHHHQKIK